MKQKFGQNFLINRNIAIREVKYADVNKKDTVLEIGPGKGIITKLLAEKAKKVIAVEIDKNLCKSLKKIIPYNVELINNDILKVDFSSLSKFNKIVSNLPFQISSPITFKLLDYNFDLAILIYQKEFAERLIANPGNKNYSRLSVNVYYKAECKLLEKVSRYCFEPVPKVDSYIIKLVPRKKPAFFVTDEQIFFELTRNLFNHRRKKIKTVINSIYKIKEENLPFKDKRVEHLTPEEISKLSNFLISIKS